MDHLTQNTGLTPACKAHGAKVQTEKAPLGLPQALSSSPPPPQEAAAPS